MKDEFRAKIAEIEALQKQQEQQQGLGRPIISTEFEDYRIVAIGSRIYYSKSWKTFHDFLLSYIKDVLGTDWGNAEIRKNFNDRHPILQWYNLVCKLQQKTIHKPGKIHSASITGAVSAYLGLAYNLYLLAHNVELQSVLINRLKNKDQFPGAYYETYVAAAFIKAGFDLILENEADNTTTHCEFTATFKETKNEFSVEAKARKPHKSSAKIGNQLYNALRKTANHKRVIFIDVNVPDDVDDLTSIGWMQESLNSLRDKEASLKINHMPAPEAYVIVTNHPFQYNLETADFRSSAFAEGFKIPTFKIDNQFNSIRDELRVREEHYEIIRLMESIKVHYDIPSTFEGEIPEFAFKENPPRLLIGHKYFVPDNGGEVMGELIDAIVVEEEKLVYGSFRIENGKSIIATCPLTEDELSAYRRYPDTFFGMFRPQCKKITSPLDLFDFLYNFYRHTPKEKLIEFLRNHPEWDSLKNESQKELAITYCEGLAYSIMNSRKNM